MKIQSILVTGAAGDIGRGLTKILNDIPWIDKIYGMDIIDTFPKSYFYHDFVKTPSVKNPNYIDFLKKILIKFNIELIIPMSEPEIRFFNENRRNSIENIPLLMPTFNVMDLGFDKLNTAIFLKDNHLPYPWTVNAKKMEPEEIPCIIKSRDGSGSKNINILTNENKNLLKKQVATNMIYQELLLPNDQEYTCGIFRSKKGIIKSIVFKRILSGGRTGYAEVVQNKDIDNLLIKLSNKINFTGSINVQLRLTKRGPIVFEINPRFSSTLVFRHILGFKDVEWAILDKFNQLDNIEFDYKSVLGKKIFRSDKEIIY